MLLPASPTLRGQKHGKIAANKMGPDASLRASCPEVVPAAVAKALRSFLADTASGAFGLRVQPLREATAAVDAKGHFSFVAAAFAGASLIALVKPGARPDVIGDCFEATQRDVLHCTCRENGPSPFLAW